MAQEETEEDTVELETYRAEGEIEDDRGLMPTEPVDSVFGFGNTLLETPRAVSSISAEMIDALNIIDIDDLVVVSPGAFTQSFFGVAGALDVRGTAGEVYFKGMRRLDNPGNYPTPLGATDRIDIVRGPSTPIMGPCKIGGYLNFVPYDAYDNLNENAYGFSQFHDSYVIEEKLIASFALQNAVVDGAIQVSPSICYTNFEHGDDYSFEYFDRRDLTQDSTSVDKLLLATQIDRDCSEYYVGDYIDYGLGVMGDFKFSSGLALTGGVRHDTIDLYTYTPEGTTTASGEFAEAENSVSGTSWSLSVSYETPWGLIPYYTQASQITVIAGQGAELTVDNVSGGTAVDDSNLEEFGVKGSFLDGRLYAALAHYTQDRTDFNAQSAVTNESVETEGTEFELRFLASENLTLSASFTQIEVINLKTLGAGSRFTFLGAEDFSSDIDPSVFYGGTVSGIVSGPAKKAGSPENSYSLVAQYNFWGNFSVVASYFHADETPSGYTGSVVLPAYDLFNAGIAYRGESWQVATNFKNITDEKYYRSNFPNLFGSSVVLPEKPFSWDISATYKYQPLVTICGRFATATRLVIECTTTRR